MKCPRCKRQLRDGARYCTACGTKIEKKRGNRLTSILLIVVLILSFAIVGCFGGVLLAKYFGISKTEVKVSSAEEAIEHAQKLGKKLGYENALSELEEKVTTTIDGDTYYRLQQNYQGIPVYGRTVVYTTDGKGTVFSITSNVVDVNSNVGITPTITYAQAVAAANAYFADNFGVEDICSSGTAEENLYIYNMTEKSLLVYSICAGAYEMLIDANSAEIVSVRQTVNANSTSAGASDNTNNYMWKNSDNTYVLRDKQRNIYIYDAKGNTYWNIDEEQVYPSVLTLVTSKDDVFGNEDDSTQTVSTAISYMEGLSSAYDFFQASFGETGCGAIVGIYNDLQDRYAGTNAGGGIMRVEDTLAAEPPDYNAADFNSQVDVVIMGSEYSNQMGDKKTIIDTIGHEYTHCISDKYIVWCHSAIFNKDEGTLFETNCENGAIREGLSDIFGELIEFDVRKKDGEMMDWANGDRTMYNPSINDYPQSAKHEVVRDKKGCLLLGDKRTDYAHGFSTVVSRAAYLMWNGGVFGDSAKRLNEKELAELWYRAMQMMPSDCDFVECRTLVELAASTMNLSDLKKQCICEAFDAVGIPRASEEEYSQLVHLVTEGETSIKGTIYEVKDVDGMETVVPVQEATMTVYAGKSTNAYKTLNIKNGNGFFEEELPAGAYSVVITADGYVGQTITFELRDKEVRYFSIELEPGDSKTENNTDAYSAYLSAAQKTTAPGKWSEHMDMTADMTMANGKTTSETKVTLTSEANISHYSESDPSQIRISGSAEMRLMGQQYAWDMEYENGTAHYQYTKPEKTSADMKIDPNIFNFGTMSRDMMTNAQMTGNTIAFTVPGEEFTKVGVAAVNQMHGVDELEYGDVDVTVTIGAEGKIDSIAMIFHASLNYQGFDTDVDYHIDYRFADYPEKTEKPAAGNKDDLRKCLDISKSWGIRKDIPWDGDLKMEQIYDFAFMENGEFYCYFYQQYTDFMYGFHGTYLFEDYQLTLRFDDEGGTHVYSFDPNAMKLTQVSKSGMWDMSPGTEYDLINDEWFPSAQDIIDAAKRAIDYNGNSDSVIWSNMPTEFRCITVNGTAFWKIDLGENGHFNATFSTSNFGEWESDYPQGTCYITKISGQFSEIEKIDAYSFRMVADSIETTAQAGEVYIEDGIRYIVEEKSVIDNGDVFYLYLPGVSHSDLPQGLVESVNNNGYYTMDNITSSTYVFYQPNPELRGYELVYLGESDVLSTPLS